MSEIKKELKLVASLDDSAFRKQIEQLKRSLGKEFSFGSQDLGDLTKSLDSIAKEFKKFHEEIKKTLEGIRQEGSGARGGMPGSSNIPGVTPPSRPPGGGGGGDDDGFFGRKGGFRTGLGVAGLAGGAYTGIREIQEQLAKNQQQFVLDALSQGGTISRIGQGGRDSLLGKLAGAAKGAGKGAAVGGLAGSFVPGIGTAAGSIAGAVYGGATGFFGGAEEEARSRMLRNPAANEALQKARAMRGIRMEALSGGGVTGSQLNITQQQGAERFGFSPQETLQQFIQSRQFLGNAGASENMGTLQEMQRRLGISAGETAQTGEVFAGAERGSMSGGVSRSVEMLKRGIAAGMDASKTSQFLKTTASYVQQSIGLGTIDVGKVGESLQQLAGGFAGPGGNVTQVQLQQAATLQGQLKQESTSTRGLSGIGNIMAVQEALGPGATSEQLLAGSQISGEATSEDIMRILGVDKDKAEKLRQGKGNALNKGMQAAGVAGSPMEFFMGARETGMTAEQFLGRKNAMDMMGPATPAEAVQLPEGAMGTKELANTIQDATKLQIEFSTGMKLLAEDTKDAADTMESFIERLNEATRALQDMAASSRVSKEVR